MKIKMYDVVRIVSIKKKFEKVFLSDGINRRLSRVGDVATVVEMFDKPSEGIMLECCDNEGVPWWLEAFGLDEIECEIIKP